MKIVNPILGDIAGSLGGITFRVQNGQTVASQKKPSKPILKLHPMFTSIIQVETVNIWKDTSVSQKEGWDQFAGSIFKPRHHTNTGTASGYNSFFSLVATAKKMDMIKIPCELKSNGVVISDQTASKKFQYSLTAPLFSGTASIKTESETDDIILNLSKVERTEENVIFTLSIVNSETESYELKQPLQDTNANEIGFVIYASTAKNASSAKNNKKFNSIVLATRPSLATTAPTVTNTVELSVSIEDLKKSVMAEYNLKSFVDLGFCLCTGEGVVTYVNKHTIQVKDIFGEYEQPPNENLISISSLNSPYFYLLDPTTDETEETPFEVSVNATATAITEKYIALGTTVTTDGTSTLRIYDRINKIEITSLSWISTEIKKIWIDDENIFIFSYFLTTEVSYLGMWDIKTGIQNSTFPIDKNQINDITFSDNHIFVGGTWTLYSSRSLAIINKEDMSITIPPAVFSADVQELAYDEKRNMLIVCCTVANQKKMQFLDIATNTILNSQNPVNNYIRNIAILGDYVYFTGRFTDIGLKYFDKINLDDYSISNAFPTTRSELYRIVKRGDILIVEDTSPGAGNPMFLKYDPLTSTFIELEAITYCTISGLSAIP